MMKTLVTNFGFSFPIHLQITNLYNYYYLIKTLENFKTVKVHFDRPITVVRLLNALCDMTEKRTKSANIRKLACTDKSFMQR